MFFWRCLERYSPETSFGHDRDMDAFLSDLDEIALGTDFLDALFDYKLSKPRFMKFIWLLFAPGGYDFTGSRRIFDWPFPLNDPERFCPKNLPEWKIKFIMDFVEEFSDEKYYGGDRYHWDMCSEAYMQLAFAILPYIEKVEDKKTRETLLERAVVFLSQNFYFERAVEGDSSSFLYKKELEEVDQNFLKDYKNRRDLISLGCKKGYRWSNSYAEESTNLAIAILPQIEEIQDEVKRKKLWRQVAVVLSQNLFGRATQKGLSANDLKDAVRFLLLRKDIIDETKIAILDRVIHKNISEVLSTRGPWALKTNWIMEPLHFYADIVGVFVKENEGIPYSSQVFYHQAAFIMEKARQYYGVGGYFPFCMIEKIFSVLTKEQSQEIAEFILEISHISLYINSEEDVKQMRLLMEHIPPEDDRGLRYRASREIRRFYAHQKECEKKIEKHKSLIRTMCD